MVDILRHALLVDRFGQISDQLHSAPLDDLILKAHELVRKDDVVSLVRLCKYRASFVQEIAKKYSNVDLEIIEGFHTGRTESFQHFWNFDSSSETFYDISFNKILLGCADSARFRERYTHAQRDFHCNSESLIGFNILETYEAFKSFKEYHIPGDSKF